MSLVAFRPPAAASDRVADLEAELASQGAELAELKRVVAAIDERTRARFELPPGYITVKAAAHLSGFKPSTLYGWIRLGRFIKSAPFGGRVYVDKNSLPKRT